MKLHTDITYKNKKCWVVDRYCYDNKTEYAIKEYKTAKIYFVSDDEVSDIAQ